MKKLFLFALLYIAFPQFSIAQTVRLQLANTSPQQVYIDSVLRATLKQRNYQIVNLSSSFTIRFAVDSKIGKEAFSIRANPKEVSIVGGNETGLIYGGLSVAEDLRNGIALQNIKAKSEKPKLAFRAIKFDMPWDTYRHSYALDLHSETCKDVNYWKAFLDMMAENRFNRFKPLESSSIYVYDQTKKLSGSQSMERCRNEAMANAFSLDFSAWQRKEELIPILFLSTFL